MKAMKFRVHSPEHSEAIQERLFKLGYSWFSGKNTQFQDKPFLYTKKNGYVLHDGALEVFLKEDAIQTTLDDLYKMTAPIIVQLNDDYIATIYKDSKTVEVGCCVFSFERIEELYKAMKQ